MLTTVMALFAPRSPSPLSRDGPPSRTSTTTASTALFFTKPISRSSTTWARPSFLQARSRRYVPHLSVDRARIVPGHPLASPGPDAHRTGARRLRGLRVALRRHRLAEPSLHFVDLLCVGHPDEADAPGLRGRNRAHPRLHNRHQPPRTTSTTGRRPRSSTRSVSPPSTYSPTTGRSPTRICAWSRSRASFSRTGRSGRPSESFSSPSPTAPSPSPTGAAASATSRSPPLRTRHRPRRSPSLTSKLLAQGVPSRCSGRSRACSSARR